MILPALISLKLTNIMALKPSFSSSSVLIVFILLCFTQSTVAQRGQLKSESRNSCEFDFLTLKFSGAWNQSNSYGVPQYALDLGLEYPGPFKMGINQFALMFVPNLNQIIAPKNASERWYLFLKVGFGAAYLKEYYSLFPYGKGAGFKYSLAYGGGFSYIVTEKIKLKLGVTYYRVESDRLDGIITIRPNHASGTDEDYYFNIKESYMHPYIGIT